MRTVIFSSAVALLFAIPLFANASVFINEIAWMGTALSATDEWIELMNDGPDTVSLTGWKLVADDGAPSISLSGNIPAGGYYLLERTDDQSVPGVAADKIYSGDLGNVGETLRVLDGEGVVVSVLTSGANWEGLGGNNTTKDTPQRQGDGGWITGVPTPKTTNTTIASETPGEVAGTSTTQATLKKKVVTGGYKQVVFAYGGEDAIGIARAALQFEGYAVSDKNVRLSAAHYEWSFGDGGKGKGKEVAHVYEEPGTYTAVLRVSGDSQRSKDKVLVTILPAQVNIVSRKSGERGYVEIKNGTNEDIDLSGWRLAALRLRSALKDALFVMPDATVITAGGSVKFSSKITGVVFDDEDTVVLEYPSGARVETEEVQSIGSEEIE